MQKYISKNNTLKQKELKQRRKIIIFLQNKEILFIFAPVNRQQY